MAEAGKFTIPLCNPLTPSRREFPPVGNPCFRGFSLNYEAAGKCMSMVLAKMVGSAALSLKTVGTLFIFTVGRIYLYLNNY